jgi:hypothetical protein
MVVPTKKHGRKERDLKVSTCAKNQTMECPEILNEKSIAFIIGMI